MADARDDARGALSPAQPPPPGAASLTPVAPPVTLEWRDLDKQRFFMFNPMVFFFIRLTQHPFNVVKTRYQVQKAHSLYASATNVLASTLRREGFRGLYRGFGTASLQLIVQQCYYVTYEALRDSRNFSSPVTESTRNSLSAAVAVLLSQIIANPIDVVAQRLMLQGQLTSNTPMPPRLASTATAVAPVAEGAAAATSRAAATQTAVQPMAALGAVDVLRSVVAHHGVRGLWNGFFISCAQFIPSASLWWGVYPHYRASLTPPLARLYDRSLAAIARWEGRAPSSGGGDAVAAAAAVVAPQPTPPTPALKIATPPEDNGGSSPHAEKKALLRSQTIKSAGGSGAAPPGLDSPLQSAGAEAMLRQRAAAHAAAAAAAAAAAESAASAAPSPPPAAPGPDGAKALVLRMPHDEGFQPHNHLHHRQQPGDEGGFSLASLLPRPARLAEVLAGGASSGTVAVLMNPADIVRTRAQVEGLPALTVLRQLVAQEGARGLWKGTLARTFMLVPQGMMSSTAYEFVKRLSAKDRSKVDGGGGAGGSTIATVPTAAGAAAAAAVAVDGG